MGHSRRARPPFLVLACACSLALASFACAVGVGVAGPSGVREAGSPVAAASIPSAGASIPSAGAYRSPYGLRYTFPVAALTAGFDTAPWNDPRQQSSVPYADWNAKHTSWGPPARQYPAPTIPAGAGIVWRQQRVIAAAASFVGTDYQHHHIPAWDPPVGWPWKPVSIGHDGPGIDCSGFSSFVYDFALGIQLQTGILTQSTTLTNPGPGGSGTVTATRITAPGGYAALVAALQTGDLLYVRSTAGSVSHVIIWLGAVGTSPDGTPLVIDAHDNHPPVVDAKGIVIPAGVEIRPFTASSWYFRSFSHALRWITGTSASQAPIVPSARPS